MQLKSSNQLKTAAALILAAAATAFSALLPYPSPMPKVATPWETTTYDTVLLRTWQGIKKRNVDAYTTGLVHRPKSETPGDAVSEGVGYGMFLALYCNDQEYFNKIWNAGERYMFTESPSNPWGGGGGSYYDWRVNQSGNRTGTGPASDADQDIALLLIFADELVKNNVWKPYTSMKGATYAVRARSLLNTIRTTMVASNGTLLPGQWGTDGAGTINPGYFAPAFYRVFAQFDSANKAAWESLIKACYDMLTLSPGYSRGLIPDWFNLEGKSTDGAGYNAYHKGDALYRDAIRVYWRLGIDYMWYREPRAKTFLDNAMRFIQGKGGPAAANFYTMAGDLLPANDIEKIRGGAVTRSRREHSQLTAGMWAAAAIASASASGDMTLARSYGDKLLEFYKPGTDYWGHAVDTTGGRSILIDGASVLVPEDTARNEMYFDQFLAWFGASMLGGVFTNVWEDLKDGLPQGPPEWKVKPAAFLSNWNIDASKEPFRVGASFTRSASWTATFKHDSTGQTRTFSGRSDTVDVVWHGHTEAGAYMPQGTYTLTISAAGLEHDVYTTKVWLGRPKPATGGIDLMEGNRLLVDDFADGNLVPYIGNVWRNYLDSQDNAGSSTGQLTVAPVTGAAGGYQLQWQYTLDFYAALEWFYGSTVDMRGVDSIIVVARSGSGNIGVSVQLISTDFNFPSEYQYFEDSLRLTTALTTYRLPISRFKQRMDGSGKNLSRTMETMRAIRFHMQSGRGASGTIIIDKMYFTGDVSKLYTSTPPPPPPPDYVTPTDSSAFISVAYRAKAAGKYSIIKNGGMVRITLPQSMAGANAAVVDIRGRVVGRMAVRQDGRLDISARGLATGMYFVEIRKVGVTTLRLPLRNIR